MITLEQIRLLEGKISRAIELIHALKEENTTLRRGLESAQRRMKELEVMVDGFKSDQKEIETVIVRTLHNLDELEEASAARRPVTPHPPQPAAPSPAAEPAPAAAAEPTGPRGASGPEERAAGAPPAEPRPSKEELDIF
jgi:hypothetical protein